MVTSEKVSAVTSIDGTRALIARKNYGKKAKKAPIKASSDNVIGE